MVDSLSLLSGVSAYQDLNSITVLYRSGLVDLEVNLEFKGGNIIAESFFPLDETVMKQLLEICGSSGFSCRLGIEGEKYVVRREIALGSISSEKVYQSVLEIISDVKKINNILLGK